MQKIDTNLSQKLNNFINTKIKRINSQIKRTKAAYLLIKIVSFVLNVLSFALTCTVLVISWNEREGAQNQEFKNWTLLLALCLVLIFVTNITLVFFTSLRKTQEYYKLIGEIKYLWFKFQMNSNYSAEKLKEEVAEAEKFYLVKRKIKKHEWAKRIILGEKD